MSTDRLNHCQQIRIVLAIDLIEIPQVGPIITPELFMKPRP